MAELVRSQHLYTMPAILRYNCRHGEKGYLALEIKSSTRWNERFGKGLTGIPRLARGYRRQGPEQNFLALPGGKSRSSEISRLTRIREELGTKVNPESSVGREDRGEGGRGFFDESRGPLDKRLPIALSAEKNVYSSIKVA